MQQPAPQSTFAYFDSGHEFPEEIAMAAGFTPYKVLGDVHASTGPGDRYVPAFVCPFSRSALTEGIARGRDWAGIAFCHGCDVTNRQYDIWKHHVETGFLYWVNSPANGNAAARVFHRHEFHRLIGRLSEHFGVTIDRDRLAAAIRLSNRVKALMRELSALRAVRDIPNVEYHALTVKCVQQPKESLVGELQAALEDWRGRPGFPEDKVPVLVTGSDISYPEWMEVLEHAGLRMVRDDMSLGERCFARGIDEAIDPVDALVEYKSSIPQPPTRLPFTARLDYLRQCLRETPVRGVIYQTLKFCEPYLLDRPYVVEQLKGDGVKVIAIEREYTPVIDQQVVSRLETFREII